MSTQITAETSGADATLHIDGRFDFKIQREFKAAYADLLANGAIKNIRVDMSKANYLDSSALGLLMLLRERAMESGKAVSLVNPSDMVRKVFTMANFDKLFTIK